MSSPSSPRARANAEPVPSPRLFFDRDTLERIRRDIDGPLRSVWLPVRDQAERTAAAAPPRYKISYEQLWQRDVGNRIATTAFAYGIAQDGRYLAGASRWAEASLGYPDWGVDPKTQKPARYGLPVGHQLLGLSMLYDYAAPNLAADLRDRLEAALRSRAADLYDALRRNGPPAYLQNHTWINNLGLAAAALAVQEKEPHASEWLRYASDIFETTASMLPPDGASQEGIGYWEYGTEYLLKFAYLSPGGQALRTRNSPFWRATPEYLRCMLLPSGGWSADNGSIVDLGDCPRTHWYGPDYQLRGIARAYPNGDTQQLADDMARAKITQPESPWLNVLWYRPDLRPTPPDPKRPTLRHFASLGIVSARTSWQPDASLVAFRCGPPVGRNVLADPKMRALVHPADWGHVHPDAGHFCLYGAGEWLIRNTGYIQRVTRFQNTLLVNDRGQDDDKGYFDGSRQFKTGVVPTVVSAKAGSDFDLIAGNAAPAYPPDLGVRRFVRRLLFWKPDILIVLDDIETERESPLELRFFPEHAAIAQPDGTLLASGKAAVLRIAPLTPDGVAVETANAELPRRHGEPPLSMPFVRLRAGAATRWRSVVAFSWAPAATGMPPRIVSMTLDGDKYTFATDDGKRTITVSLANTLLPGSDV